MHRRQMNLLLILLTLVLLVANAAQAEVECPSGSYVGSFLSVRAEGMDLIVQLAWAEHCKDLPQTFKVELETRSGQWVAEESASVPTYVPTPVLDPPGSVVGSVWRAKMSAPNVSSGYILPFRHVLETVSSSNEWSYRLKLINTDEGPQRGKEIAERFPFHVTAGECLSPENPKGPVNPYRVLPGVSTDAVVVSFELDRALDGCQNLDNLAVERPDLACEIAMLKQQLTSIGSAGGGCFWEAVVFGENLDLTPVAIATEESASYSGALAGAGHCFSRDAVGGMAGATASTVLDSDCGAPPLIPFLGATLKLRCYDPAGNCPSPCSGLVDYSAGFEVITDTQVDGGGLACASESVALWVNSGYVLEHHQTAAEPERPLSVTKKGSGLPDGSVFAVASSGSAQALATPSGSYAYAEYGNDYLLQINGKGAVCAAPSAELSIRSPDLLRARLGFQTYFEQGFETLPQGSKVTKAQLGGIKTRRRGL